MTVHDFIALGFLQRDGDLLAPAGRPRSLDAMWEHIETLAARYKFKIDTARVDRPEDAFAVPWARTICIPPLRSAVGYATALHEVGHLLGPNQGALDIEGERAAWRWARDNAIVWTSSMERCAVRSLAKFGARKFAR